MRYYLHALSAIALALGCQPAPGAELVRHQAPPQDPAPHLDRRPLDSGSIDPCRRATCRGSGQAGGRDGYFSTLGCVEFERAGVAGQVPYMPGGMGVHFLNVGLIGPVPDPAKPPVLIYEPDGDKLRLVAAEWFIPLATGVKERPTLWNRPFDGPMTGHPPLLPMELSHYDLHVWLYKPNPLGTFAPTNPTSAASVEAVRSARRPSSPARARTRCACRPATHRSGRVTRPA
jgi:hypothetical protein